MYKIVEEIEKNKFEVFAEGDFVDITNYLTRTGIMYDFHYIDEYIESVLNGNEDNIYDYLRDTIENFAIGLRTIKIEDILKSKVKLYMNDTGDTILAIPEDGKPNLEQVNRLTALYGMRVIEEV